MAQRLAKRKVKDVSLRTIVWTEAVLRISGKPLAALEREFCVRRKKGSPPRSCIWQKYKNGTVVPRSGGKTALVERVEARYPGTAAWFYSPLWSLCTDQSVGIDGLKEIYCELGTKVRELFVQDDAKMFWRKRFEEFNDIDLCDDLIRTPGIDGLIALYALMKESELIQDPVLFDTAAKAIGKRLTETQMDKNVLNREVRIALVDRVGELHKAYLS